MMINNSTETPHEDKSSDINNIQENKKDGVLICHKFHKENNFAKDCKANVIKDKEFYLKMAQEVEDKEKGKALVAQVQRDHQVFFRI